jgi:hypothetical protein
MAFTTPTFRSTGDRAQAPNQGVASDGQSVIEQEQYHGTVDVNIDGKKRDISKAAAGNMVPYANNAQGHATLTRRNAGVIMVHDDHGCSFDAVNAGKRR